MTILDRIFGSIQSALISIPGINDPVEPDPSPQPLCNSASIDSVDLTPLASQNPLLKNESSLAKNLRLFGSEAIPLSSVDVSGTSMSFGDVKISQSTSKTFTVTNNSDCQVNYTVSGVPYGFSVSSYGGSLSAKSSVTVTVTFNPYYEQNYSGSISVTPNGSSVSVSGRGVKN